MATTKASFVFQNLEAVLAGGTTVTAIPFVMAMERQAALNATGRQAGGGSYNQDASSGSPAAANAIVMLDDIPTSAALDAYAKHGVYHKTTSGTTAVQVNLQNLATGATTYAGDTVFATWYRIIIYNLTGLDGVAAAGMTVAPGSSNPLTLFNGTTPTLAVPASSRVIFEITAGQTVSGTVNSLQITPTAGGNVCVVVCGA